MKKLLGGIGYLTWFIANLGILYGFGAGVMNLVESNDLDDIVLKTVLGMILFFLITVLSVLAFALITMVFGTKEMQDKVNKWLSPL